MAMLLECDQALYRAESYYFPEEIWSVKDQVWKPYKGKVPKPQAWADLVDDEEADELKKPV